MQVAPFVWIGTLLVVVLIFGIDLAVVARRQQKPSMRRATTFVVIFCGLAIMFGIGVGLVSGPQYAGQFFAGWVTEYSLSLDNLFIFVIIMTRFRVPAAAQQTVLVVGIVLALVFRGIFIAAGSAVISRYSWVFYLFGAFLIWTAIGLARSDDDDADEFSENALLRLVRRVVPSTDEYDGVKLSTQVDGRRLYTPMLVVMVAIGSTDLLFALDSIPAIFGLTKEPYLVFTANAFALMGLSQLYFLIGGLLDRLVYLGTGLALVLAFIGFKLIFEALHTNTLPFLNGGNPVSWAPEISTGLSLAVIGFILGVTAAASLLHTRRSAR